MTDIVKSPQDERQYKNITLDNHLQVILIHDAETDKSAAAMDVNVGYYKDPDGCEGLAHFLEHMLFLGSEKYPDEKEYINYLTQHGGNWNAYTSSENTNFYFDVNYTQLEGALDRFAQFFICPLFTRDCTDREMNAVHSEHSKNLKNDAWRFSQLMRSFASTDHPYHKFGTGSLETLKKHADILDKLFEFHGKYYSSNIMKLVILGRESIDDLEKWAREKFSAVKNKNVVLPPLNGEPFPSKQFVPVRYKVVPVKDLRKITIYWNLPEQYSLWKSKPSHLLGHLIGHEGPGSILSYLKQKGWVNTLVAGIFDQGSNYSFFGVEMGLTESGLLQTDQLVETVFQYIALLRQKGVDEWVFKELQSLSNIEFQFKDNSSPISYVSALARRMQLFPYKHVIDGPTLLFEWNPAEVKKIIDALTTEVIVLEVSKTYEDSADKAEKWYSTRFSEDRIRSELLKHWQNSDITAPIHLPLPNPFIPDDFSIKHNSDSKSCSTKSAYSDPANTHHPDCYKTSQSSLWHKMDDTFRKPKLYQCINFISKLAYDSPKACVMAKLYVKLIMDAINEYTYDAQVAGIRFTLVNYFEGIQLQVHGYNCKQHVLIEKLAEKMKNLYIDPMRFDIIKELTKRGYHDFWKDQPYQRAIYQLNLCLEDPRWTNEEFLEVCPNITLPELQEWISAFLSELYYEILVYGNASKEDAFQTRAVIEKIFNAKPLAKENVPKRLKVQLQPKTYIHALRSFNEVDHNSAIVVNFETGRYTNAEYSILDLFAHICYSSCFSQLRTKEQLGYIVHSSSTADNGVMSFRVIIQSDTKDPGYLDTRIEEWIESFKKDIEALTEDEFIKFRTSLIGKILEKDKSLKEEYHRWYNEIQYPRPFQFDRAPSLAKEVEKLQKSDLISFYDNHIAKTGLKRRKISALVYSKDHLIPEGTNTEDTIHISKPEEFRKTQSTYDVFHEILDFSHSLIK